MTWSAAIAAALRRARLDAGLTQEALAERLGCAVATVQRAEYGRRTSADILHAWWRVCGVRPRIEMDRERAA